jgi:hypothetical protein
MHFIFIWFFTSLPKSRRFLECLTMLKKTIKTQVWSVR